MLIILVIAVVALVISLTFTGITQIDNIDQEEDEQLEEQKMVGGAQPKVLLTQDEDGNLQLDQMFGEVFAKESEHKYKLVRDRDGLTKTSKLVIWMEFDKNGKYKNDYNQPAIGRSLLMSPFNQFFTWQTTLVTEIVEQREGYIKFKTENSNYELFTL